ncbi:MAG: DUF11 domain-containing protein [Gammaproteobacteria bacterium]|nr:DUF11 domain-containing protein [Gammaproteobacteria bacterium]MDH3374291.1 DUF11 domain-containing protein [Gammaproteobacteria bacterium]MDH3409530.1 DUF11 domain-containing protein [Gammaproteobacteria bacterium]MDH3552370.1 DUF11 domain-containing protein [Gammaproteobacteria bacterium]
MDNNRKSLVIGMIGLGFAQLGTAAGTIAGTDIDNTAVVSYEVVGTPQTVTSNTVTLTVAEVLDVDVTLLSGPASVVSGSTTQELLFVVTNTGNGTEGFQLAINNALSGDDFDPVASTPAAIYFDTDASGDFSAGDIAYTPGSNDPQLAPDASVDVLLVNDIPASLADGAIGLSELGAAALTGTGDPGDRFPGDGDGGIDAVVGTSGADDAVSGQYLISDIRLDVIKSATVLDPFGGSDPVPGAEITYRIVVTPTGTETATNTVFTDPIPANTTYLANSITLNSGALTDAADADVGVYTATPMPEISVDLGDLIQASGAQTIEFTVTIN